MVGGWNAENKQLSVDHLEGTINFTRYSGCIAFATVESIKSRSVTELALSGRDEFRAGDRVRAFVVYVIHR